MEETQRKTAKAVDAARDTLVRLDMAYEDLARRHHDMGERFGQRLDDMEQRDRDLGELKPLVAELVGAKKTWRLWLMGSIIALVTLFASGVWKSATIAAQVSSHNEKLELRREEDQELRSEIVSLRERLASLQSQRNATKSE